MRRAVWATAVLTAVCACQLIAGLETRVVADKDAADAASEASGDPCSQVGVPIRPDGPSSPSDSLSFTFALTAIDFGFVDGGPPSGLYGLNLDQTCTCPGADSCIRPVEAGTVCDVPPNGIDNNGNILFREASDLNFVTQMQLNQALQTGESGAIIRIDGYNGQLNDSLVTVSVYSSHGIEGFLQGGVPANDGNDHWVLDEESVIGGAGTNPVHSDPTAYVANGAIVTELDFPVTIGSTTTAPVTVELTAGRILANISKGDAGLEVLSGIFAGRWQTTKMLTSFQQFADPFGGGQAVCGTDNTYLLLHDIVCRLADITRIDTLDNRNNPCDSVAVGIHFDALQAKLGSVAPHADAGSPCGVDWVGSCP